MIDKDEPYVQELYKLYGKEQSGKIIFCAKCGKDKCENFAVKDNIWAKTGIDKGDFKGVLHIKCLEDILGRRLNKFDFRVGVPSQSKSKIWPIGAIWDSNGNITNYDEIEKWTNTYGKMSWRLSHRLRYTGNVKERIFQKRFTQKKRNWSK